MSTAPIDPPAHYMPVVNSDTDNLRPVPESNFTSFESDLCNLINRYSMDNGSNTPEFILASYMMGCLTAFNEAVRKRTRWYQSVPE